jgi:hypothetical protein
MTSRSSSLLSLVAFHVDQEATLNPQCGQFASRETQSCPEDKMTSAALVKSVETHQDVRTVASHAPHSVFMRRTAAVMHRPLRGAATHTDVIRLSKYGMRSRLLGPLAGVLEAEAEKRSSRLSGLSRLCRVCSHG